MFQLLTQTLVAFVATVAIVSNDVWKNESNK